MRYALAFSLALSGISANAVAAVSSEEAAQLGKALTLFGAEQAGNEAGTIPTRMKSRCSASTAATIRSMQIS
mgnify:CR=1 FL=1